MTYLALLRGINVGGKARLPMKDLAAIFRAAGAENIRTYIQSGNVLFASPTPELLIAAVTGQIAAQFGYPGRIVLRSADELCNAYTFNPFAGEPAKFLHVYFLADWPSETAVAGLDPNRSPGDTFAVRNREVYLHLPNGMARTKLTNAYFDAKLRSVSTARNWTTVAKLVDLAG